MARYKDSGSASKEKTYIKNKKDNNNNNNCNSPTPDPTTQGKHLITNDTQGSGMKPKKNNNNSKTTKTYNRRHRTRKFKPTTHQNENIALRTTPLKRTEQNRTNRVKYTRGGLRFKESATCKEAPKQIGKAKLEER